MALRRKPRKKKEKTTCKRRVIKDKKIKINNKSSCRAYAPAFLNGTNVKVVFRWGGGNENNITKQTA